MLIRLALYGHFMLQEARSSFRSARSQRVRLEANAA